MGGYHLAELNIARFRAPMDAPELADFVAALQPVNALADAADGFVWRLQTEEGNATSIPVLGDDRLIVNMSVWESLEALREYVYRDPGHLEIMRRRREFFEHMREAYMVLWWVPAGHRPTVAEAEERLLHLRAHGATPYAFTLRTSFPPGAAEAVEVSRPA